MQQTFFRLDEDALANWDVTDAVAPSDAVAQMLIDGRILTGERVVARRPHSIPIRDSGRGCCFLTPQGLDLLRHGKGAPVWRAAVTLENCVLVNSIAAAILLLCVGFVAKRMCFWYEPFENVQEADQRRATPLPRSRFAPFFAMLAFAVVPQFAGCLMKLTPQLVALVPVFLSAALVASLNSKVRDLIEPDEYCEDGRRGVGLRLALAGALAAVAVWESTYGIALALPLLAITWFPFIRRGRPVSVASAFWVFGFVAVFLSEPELLPDCPWLALMPKNVPIDGIVVFLFVGVMPLAVVRRLGENRWTLGLWGLLLLVFAVFTASTGRFARQSASERFVRHVLADLGDRKHIVGDGVFDVMIDEWRPSGVKRIGTTTVAEREFLLNRFAANESVTNRILVVDRYYGYGEMAEASREVGRGLVQDEPDPRSLPKLSDEDRVRISALRKKAFFKQHLPLFESIKAMNEGWTDVPDSLRAEEVENARENIRRGWKSGFWGLPMSATLLALDMRFGDVKALEHDAITALILDRGDPAANAALGSLRLKTRRIELAEKYLERGVRGGGALAMGSYAKILVQRGRFAEAADWARKAAEKKPKDWTLREALAAALIESGKLDEAAKELKTIEDLAVEAGQMKAAEPFLSGARKRHVELHATTKAR